MHYYTPYKSHSVIYIIILFVIIIKNFEQLLSHGCSELLLYK